MQITLCERIRFCVRDCSRGQKKFTDSRSDYANVWEKGPGNRNTVCMLCCEEDKVCVCLCVFSFVCLCG